MLLASSDNPSNARLDSPENFSYKPIKFVVDVDSGFALLIFVAIIGSNLPPISLKFSAHGPSWIGFKPERIRVAVSSWRLHLGEFVSQWASAARARSFSPVGRLDSTTSHSVCS